MTTKTIKLVAFVALLVHGIGHFQGVVASFGVKINNTKPSLSWLLKDFDLKFNHSIAFILFLSTGILGIISALSLKGYFFPNNVWQTMTILTAIFSSICLVLYPNNFAMFFNKIGAIGVNLFIFYSIVFHNNWPSVLFED